MQISPLDGSSGSRGSNASTSYQNELLLDALSYPPVANHACCFRSHVLSGLRAVER